MTPEEREARNAAIIEAYKRKERIADIAARHGLSKSGVQSVVNRARDRRRGEIPHRTTPSDKLGDYDAWVADLYRQGNTPPQIAGIVDRNVQSVYQSLGRSRAKKLLPPPAYATDPRRHVERMKWNGWISGMGHVVSIVDTLTPAQLDHLFKEAPKARTVAEAIAVFLAINLPEEE